MHGEIGIPTRFYRILNKFAECFRYIPAPFYTKISALFQSNFRGEAIVLEDQFYKLTLKLALLTRLTMDLLLLILKVFFKVTSRHGIL